MVIEIYYVPLAKEIVSTLRVGTILDLGTGPGFLPIEIAKRSPSISVDGIDLSHRLIDSARLNASNAGLSDRLHFEIGNASRLRFDDESYDMVISTGMLHMLKDPVKVFQECNRVLKKGGRAWIFDPARVSSQVDTQKWKTSLTLWERLMYVFFLLFARVNPARIYERQEVVPVILAAHFKEYEIQKEGEEIRIKLIK